MHSSRTTLLFALAGLASALLLAYCHTGSGWPEGDSSAIDANASDGGSLPGAVEAAETFYAGRPVHERTRPPLPVPAGLPDLSARTCGACHRAIYEEWQLSTHRRAWLDDAQFQAELLKNQHLGRYVDEAGETKEGDAGWICLRCHTPVSDQQARLTVGLEGDHVTRPRYVDNPRYDMELQHEAITCAVCHVRDDGVIIGPYGDTDAPHPVARGEALLNGDVCLPCHQAEVRYDDAGLLCAFGTGREWQASSYASEGQACPSCHMPEVTRPLVEGRAPRPTRRHWFGGSLIPKRPEFAAGLLPLRAVYGSGVDIELRRVDGRLAIWIKNSRAGHRVPTGDPERYLLVRARALSASSRVVAETELRIGTIYDWNPPAHMIEDNRLMPEEERLMNLGAAPGAVSVELVGEKFRIGQEAFDYHRLEGRYVAGRIFHRSTWSLVDGAPALLTLVDDLHPATPTADASVTP